jgi:hypothetical protein
VLHELSECRYNSQALVTPAARRTHSFTQHSGTKPREPVIDASSFERLQWRCYTAVILCALCDCEVSMSSAAEHAGFVTQCRGLGPRFTVISPTASLRFGTSIQTEDEQLLVLSKQKSPDTHDPRNTPNGNCIASIDHWSFLLMLFERIMKIDGYIIGVLNKRQSSETDLSASRYVLIQHRDDLL